jgi:hypothetical protein
VRQDGDLIVAQLAREIAEQCLLLLLDSTRATEGIAKGILRSQLPSPSALSSQLGIYSTIRSHSRLHYRNQNKDLPALTQPTGNQQSKTQNSKLDGSELH